MDFWLSYNNFSESLQLPVNPGEFSVKAGNKNTVVDIQDLGELNLIGRSKLAEVQIASFFPATWAPYCAYQNIPKPYDAVALIEKWRQTWKPIRLIIAGTPINQAMAIEDFEYGEKGGTRDINYTLSLKEYRFITVQQVGQQATGTSAQRPDNRATPASYTIKEGDSLFLIAKKVYGDGGQTNQDKIYNANKAILGNDPGLVILWAGDQMEIP